MLKKSSRLLEVHVLNRCLSREEVRKLQLSKAFECEQQVGVEKSLTRVLCVVSPARALGMSSFCFPVIGKNVLYTKSCPEASSESFYICKP